MRATFFRQTGASSCTDFVCWNRFSICGHGLTCGWALGPAVVDDFVAPFPFTGELEPVVIDVEGAAVVDPIAEAFDAVESQ